MAAIVTSSATQAPPAISASGPGGGYLQPKCECARQPHGARQCAECLEGPSDAALTGRCDRTQTFSAGQPLAREVREHFERRFGQDFADVRVHSERAAAESATALGALGYAFGRHLVFAPGRYAPHTAEGRRLLAHELAHVVQQRKAGTAVVQGKIDPWAPRCIPCEKERRALEKATAELNIAADWARVMRALVELAKKKVEVACQDPDSSECAEAQAHLERERDRLLEAEKREIAASIWWGFHNDSYQACMRKDWSQCRSLWWKWHF